jgi:nicotinamidase-related amidase
MSDHPMVNGPKALIEPDNSVLLLIDFQPYTLLGLRSHDPQMAINNVTALAKMAKAFRVPTILTGAAIHSVGGAFFPEITDVFPDQKVYDRTNMNAWEDPVVKDAVLATGRPNIVMAGLWTEVCLAYPALHAREEGRSVFAVTDASGGGSPEAHERGVQRMVQAGVVPMTIDVVAGEWFRDLSRLAQYPDYGTILKQHYGNWGQALLYFQHVASLAQAPQSAQDRAA